MEFQELVLILRLQAKKLDIFASSGIDIGFLRNKDMNLLITFIPNILATQ